MTYLLIFIYLLILIYASYIDIVTRKVPSCVILSIIILAITKMIIDFSIINIIYNVIGSIVIFSIFLVPNFIKDGAIGGGDIKFMSSSTLFLGLEKIIISTIIALSMMIIIELIKNIKNKKHINNLKCALVPYLSLGCFFSLLI